MPVSPPSISRTVSRTSSRTRFSSISSNSRCGHLIAAGQAGRQSPLNPETACSTTSRMRSRAASARSLRASSRVSVNSIPARLSSASRLWIRAVTVLQARGCAQRPRQFVGLFQRHSAGAVRISSGREGGMPPQAPEHPAWLYALISALSQLGFLGVVGTEYRPCFRFPCCTCHLPASLFFGLS